MVEEAVRGGVRFVLLRERDLGETAFARLAERLAGALPREVILSIHGRPAVAAALHAGLHLPEGAPPPAAGPSWHGRSVHGSEAASRARRDGVAYIVAGTIFPSVGKPGIPPAGVEGLRAMCAAAHPVPVYAIGGLSAARAGEVRAAGAHGVAVVGAILEADAPEAAARALVKALGGLD